MYDNKHSLFNLATIVIHWIEVKLSHWKHWWEGITVDAKKGYCLILETSQGFIVLHVMHNLSSNKLP